MNTLNDLTERGVVFVSLKDGVSLESSTGRLMAGLMACFAQFELEVIPERVRSGFRHVGRNKKRAPFHRARSEMTSYYALAYSSSWQEIGSEAMVFWSPGLYS